MTSTRRRLLGQHFLHSPGVAISMIETLKKIYTGDETVLEIGAGNGNLTILLHKNNINFLSIEIDRHLHKNLIEKYPELSGKVLNKDFRRLKLDEFPSPLILFGSFPYILTGQIINALFRWYGRIRGLVGLFQWEVGCRLCATPGTKHYGAVTAGLWAGYSSKIIRKVGRGAFNPPPGVESALVLIEKKEEPALPENYIMPFASFLRRFFSYRRKKMRNAAKILAMTGIEEEYLEKRPEEISPPEFVTLFKELYSL